jgi:hypothetical protein
LFKVELIEEINKRGVFRYRVPSLALEGPFPSAACRQIESILGPTEQRAGLFVPAARFPQRAAR